MCTTILYHIVPKDARKMHLLFILFNANKCKIINMDEQKIINRLVNCGYSHADAVMIYQDFEKIYSDAELEEYLESMERDMYVG